MYVGYYETHHPGNPQPKPDPWRGSADVVFVGRSDTQSGGWDTSTVRIDNLSDVTLVDLKVRVGIGSARFHLWGERDIPTGASLIIAQKGEGTFDGSDTNTAGCFDCDPSLCETGLFPRNAFREPSTEEPAEVPLVEQRNEMQNHLEA